MSISGRGLKHRATPNRLFTHTCAVLGFFAPMQAVLAQTPRLSEQSVRFTVFSSRPVTGLTYVPRTGIAPTKLVLYPTARSPRYDYRGAMPLRLTDTTTGAVVAEAVIPPEIHDALLLLAPIEPVPATGLRYRVSVLDDGAARHGTGGLTIINFSGLVLAGSVGKTDVTLKDGLNPTLAVGRSAKVMLRTMVKGRSFQSYAATLQLSGKERALLILFPPFYKGSLEVQSRLLVDEPPVPPAMPAAGREK
ncbi:MAG: hypothetical protein EXS32_03810 [Opitutus sp.]|nr:hypothetical protein [Opitutus sp.]